MPKTQTHPCKKHSIKAAAASNVFDSSDLLGLIVSNLPAKHLRRAAPVAHLWHAAVDKERARRLKLPRTRWALVAGKPPDLNTFETRHAPYCARVDVVGGVDASGLPPMPFTLDSASAVVLANGTLCVCGESMPPPRSFKLVCFCPRRWKWWELPPLPAERARRCITLASSDGARLLALGGFVGQSECKVEGDNACNLVDAFCFERNVWTIQAPLPEKMIAPVVLSRPGASGDGTLAFWRTDNDEIAHDGVVALTPGNDVAISGLFSHQEEGEVAAVQLQSDLIVAAHVDVDDERLALYACRPRGTWIPMGTISMDDLGAATGARPTIACCALSGVQTVVVGHSFLNEEDNGRIRSHSGWWGAPLDAVRQAVVDDAAGTIEWRSVRNAVGTPVREDAECVLLPTY